MLKRSPFKTKPPISTARVKIWTGEKPTPRAAAVRVADLSARLVVPLAKQCALQHLGYMAAVRKLRCGLCLTTTAARQFCHRDEGKGMGIKTDCREGWPGCAHCHWFVGTSGQMGKERRRAFEWRAGAETRAAVIAADAWPKRLPMWEEI